MSITPPTPADLPEQAKRAPGGLLAAALPAPPGWERGLVIPFYGCGEPILRDKCIRSTDEAHRPNIVDFASFPIEQGATCSTISGIDQEAHATDRLDATTEWALGRQLATDQVGTGSPALNDAPVLGTLDGREGVVDAVACLEQAAADTGYGTAWWLHTSPRGAAYARRYGMMDKDGKSPSGARWIVSPGYPGSTADGGFVRYWVTGPVWAAVDAPQVNAAVDWRTNDDAAYAMRAGIVAFDPCINFAYDISVGVTCGNASRPSTWLEITSPAEGSVVEPVFDVRGTGAEPGATVELWFDDHTGTPAATATADSTGDFIFAGNTPGQEGPRRIWVSSDGRSSPHVEFTVVDSSVTESFEWEQISQGRDGEVTLVLQALSGTVPRGTYEVTVTGYGYAEPYTDRRALQNDAEFMTLLTIPGRPSDTDGMIQVIGSHDIDFTASGNSGSPQVGGQTVIDSGTVTYRR